MKKIVSFFQTISILLGCLVMLFFLIPMLIGIKPFIVLSGSMEPNIHVGSVAYVNTHTKVEDIKKGDIIGFSFSDSQVTHRVIEVNENNTFTTKGDANNVQDSAPVKFENYIGKTVFSIPYIGKIIAKARTKVGIFLITVIVGLNVLFIVFDDVIFQDFEDKRKKSRKRKISELNSNFSNMDELFDKDETNYIREIVKKELLLMKNEIVKDMVSAQNKNNIPNNNLFGGGRKNEKN